MSPGPAPNLRPCDPIGSSRRLLSHQTSGRRRGCASCRCDSATSVSCEALSGIGVTLHSRGRRAGVALVRRGRGSASGPASTVSFLCLLSLDSSCAAGRKRNDGIEGQTGTRVKAQRYQAGEVREGLPAATKKQERQERSRPAPGAPGGKTTVFAKRVGIRQPSAEKPSRRPSRCRMPALHIMPHAHTSAVCTGARAYTARSTARRYAAICLPIAERSEGCLTKAARSSS